MSDRTATEPHPPYERERVSELADAVERVLSTHLAPVTGLEEEVARILSEPGTGGSEERG